MKKSNFKVYLAIIAFLVIAASVAVYYLSEIQKTQINSYAFRFVLLAEFVLFAGLGLLQNSQEKFVGTYAKLGIIVTLFLYLSAALGLSLMGTGLKINIFILGQIIFICVAAILSLIFLFVSQCIYKQQASIKENGRDLQTVKSILYSLTINGKYKKFHDDIAPVYEMIRYFDPTAVTEFDDDIINRINYLQKSVEKVDIADSKIQQICNELASLCAQRQLASAQIKRGGF